MPDERTYGFNKDDADALVQSIGVGENWFPEIKPRGSNGGTGHHIWFTIDSVICNDDDTKTLIVTPTWYTGGCEATIPGEDDYGLIEVDDPCRLLEFYTAEWLESGGIVGRATYMYPRNTAYCVPRWLVDTICGTPECA
jgi:hypothetical protein